MRVREVEVTYSATRVMIDGRRPLSKPAQAVELIRQLIIGDNREHFAALYLDARRRLVAFHRVSIGTCSQSLVHPRELFQPAVLIGAQALIALHNHPSGNPEPSPEDREVTTRIAQAGELLGIHVLDHIIWTRHDGYVSLAERGWLERAGRS